MTARITIKPAEGRLVRHPGNYQPLAADGEAVEQNSYWVRKLRAGDVVEVNEADEGQKTKGAK
jgi:hypothetical protein